MEFPNLEKNCSPTFYYEDLTTEQIREIKNNHLIMSHHYDDIDFYANINIDKKYDSNNVVYVVLLDKNTNKQSKYYLRLQSNWPEGSQLKPEHFTFDFQSCLMCQKILDGIQMPSNEQPCWKDLFCSNCWIKDNEKEYMRCYGCGNINNFFSHLNLVSHPANSAYYGPSDSYVLMCNACLKDQEMNTPSVEETRQKMKEFIQYREECEEMEKYGNLNKKRFEIFNPSPFSTSLINSTNKKRKIG